MPWIAAILRHTGAPHMPAFDISLTDFLSTEARKPAFLLYNRENEMQRAVFTPAPIWNINDPITVDVPPKTALVVEI